MASAGMVNAGTLLERSVHAELSRQCAAAGITLADHIRRCLELGRKQLEKEAARRQKEHADE